MNYSSFNVEAAVSQVIGNRAVLYPFFINVVVNLTTHGKIIPYAIVGGGLYSVVPARAVNERTVSALGMNFGGGFRYFLTETFGFRFESKQSLASVKRNGAERSDLLIFLENSLGLTFMID